MENPPVVKKKIRSVSVLSRDLGHVCSLASDMCGGLDPELADDFRRIIVQFEAETRTLFARYDEARKALDNG